MFRTSSPVTGGQFEDRSVQLEQLQRVVASVREGAPRWLAILGPRKVGKTSLVLELARLNTGGPVRFVVLDSNRYAPLGLDVFRRYALRAADALLGPALGFSLESVADQAADLAAELADSDAVAALPAEARRGLLQLAQPVRTPDRLAALLELPEQLAEALGVGLLAAWDEFQLLGSLRHGTRSFDPFPRMRAVWQTHKRVGYVISGSAPSMLRELTSSERSPFFQHFDIIELGAMSRPDALALLRGGADGCIPEHLCERVVDLVGGHPFYLQLMGQELLDGGPPWDDAAFKEAAQRLLFSPNGRLAMYFQREFDRVVGRATTLAATLGALARSEPGGLTVTEVARAIGAGTGPAVRYLERLADVVEKGKGGRWRIGDPTFATWLRWRDPSGRVVPMTSIGSEAELSVARKLASAGFDLVYQARASRGAFDLLALRGPTQLGIQVKRHDLPIAFALSEWQRMDAEASRLGWRWLVASVSRSGEVHLLDPARARVRRTARLHTDAAIDNLLRWVDSA